MHWECQGPQGGTSRQTRWNDSPDSLVLTRVVCPLELQFTIQVNLDICADLNRMRKDQRTRVHLAAHPAHRGCSSPRLTGWGSNL